MKKPGLMLCRTAACGAGLLAVGIGGAVAEQVPYRAALVDAEVTCRVAPSDSAQALGLLRVGSGWGTEFAVVRTEADEAGETWIRVESRDARPYGLDEDCWVPESVVAPTEGARHLLQLADRLLSAAAWPPLERFLAAHNLFVHPAYREQVEASPALSERRTMLLAKAVEAAQRSKWFAGRPVDRDPLVLAWIESLGEHVRYSGDGRGRGTWTAEAAAHEADRRPLESQQVAPAIPDERRELAVVVNDVACPGEPGRAASSWTILGLDFHFRADRPDTTVDGRRWVFVRDHQCWVPAAHTAPAATDEHVLAIADRFLTSGLAWSADNRLRVYNVLSSRNLGHGEEVENSPILALRRLDVLRVALRSFSPFGADALTRAWIGALGDEVRLIHEGHSWSVSDEAYLALYERHRADPFAEEIMWRHVSGADPWDCEGDFVCTVDEMNTRLARYWIDFPGGRHVADALKQARTVLGYGLESCNAARGPNPDAYEERTWRLARWKRSVAEVMRELLGTLEAVSEEDKAPLLETLSELEACAAVVG